MQINKLLKTVITGIFWVSGALLISHNAFAADKANSKNKVSAENKVLEKPPTFNVFEIKVNGNTVLPIGKIEESVYPFLGETKTIADALAVPINAVTTRDKNDENKNAQDKKGDTKTEDAAPTSNDEDDIRDVVVFVYNPTEFTVKKVKVKTGIQDTKYIQITEGLKGGEEVVSEPYNIIYKILKDAMKVKVVDKEKLFEVKK